MAAAIYPKLGREFKIASEGKHAAVLAFIEDLGMVDTDFLDDDGNLKSIPKIRLFFIVDEDDEKGAPLSVNQDFHNSCFETAKLYQLFKGLGITLTQTTDLNQFVGMQVLLDVFHKTSKKGKTYANIAFPVLPAIEDQPFVEIPKNWVAPNFTKRGSLAGSVQDGPTIRMGLTRPSTSRQAAPIKETQLEIKPEIDDSDIPF